MDFFVLYNARDLLIKLLIGFIDSVLHPLAAESVSLTGASRSS